MKIEVYKVLVTMTIPLKDCDYGVAEENIIVIVEDDVYMNSKDGFIVINDIKANYIRSNTNLFEKI